MAFFLQIEHMVKLIYTTCLLSPAYIYGQKVVVTWSV